MPCTGGPRGYKACKGFTGMAHQMQAFTTQHSFISATVHVCDPILLQGKIKQCICGLLGDTNTKNSVSSQRQDTHDSLQLQADYMVDLMWEHMNISSCSDEFSLQLGIWTTAQSLDQLCHHKNLDTKTTRCKCEPQQLSERIRFGTVCSVAHPRPRLFSSQPDQ